MEQGECCKDHGHYLGRVVGGLEDWFYSLEEGDVAEGLAGGSEDVWFASVSVVAG